MYKMVIVDDNILENRGIAGMIDYESIGISLIGTYTSSRDALINILTQKPDIILTDISMPVMNGIDMVQKLRGMGVHSKVVFMSCYSDFEYAKEGITLKVNCYLTKPFSKEALKAVLIETICEIDIERKEEKEIKELYKTVECYKQSFKSLFLKQLLYGEFENESEINRQAHFLDTLIVCEGIFCVCILIYEPIEPSSGIQDYLTNLTFEKILNDSGIRESFYIHTTQESKYECNIIFNCAIEQLNYYNMIVDFLILLKEKMLELKNINTRIGISNAEAGVMKVPLLYQRAKECVKERYIAEQNDIIRYEDINNSDEFSFFNRANPIEIYDSIKGMILNTKKDEAGKLFSKYFPKDCTVYSEHYIRSFLSLCLSVIKIVTYEINPSIDELEYEKKGIPYKNINTLQDIKEWIELIIKELQDEIFQQDNQEAHSVTEKIKRFIKENYKSQITVQDISDSVFMSPKCANKVFKGIEKKTMFDYLVKYRMEKAKQLLLLENSKLYWIANEVGYSNISHFCYLFKKHMGTTPNEYRNMNRKDV